MAEAQARVGEALGRLTSANAAPEQVAVRRAQVETASAEIEQAEAAVRQAAMLAFLDDFWLLGVLALATVPLALLIKTIRPGRSPEAGH